MRPLRIILGCVLALSLGSCAKKEVDKTSLDFETLMGKGSPAWQFVRTREDVENLHFFQKLYEKNFPRLTEKPTLTRVPKVVHFIWVGPKPFPRESIENVRSWIAKHPQWTFKFWTDRDHPLPHPKMQRCAVQDLQFLKLYDCYRLSDNYGEKSDILRYEILYQEGGIYVDHDVKCFKSFDQLGSVYDLFLGLQMPSTTCLSSSVVPTNNIVAARPGHPVLKRCLEWLSDNWDRIEREYPGKDKDSVINRVAHRTFSVLGDSVKLLADQEDNHDIVFPAFYFNAPSDAEAIFSRHLLHGTWFENESAFEKLVRERLMKISKKTNKLFLFLGVLSLVNLMGFMLLFSKYRRALRKT